MEKKFRIPRKCSLTKIIILTGLFCAHLAPGIGQDTLLPEFKAIDAAQRRMPALDTQFKAYKAFQFPVNQLADYVKGKSRAEFRLNLGEEMVWDLSLEPSGLVAKDYKLTLQTESGIQTIYSKPDYLYKGKLRDGEGGNIRLAIKQGFIYGSISIGEKEWMIEPASRHGKSFSKNEFLVYETRDIVEGTNFSCGFSEEDGVARTMSRPGGDSTESPLSSDCRKIKVLQVADFQMLEQFGMNIDSLQTFLLANMNATEGVYTGFNFDPNDSTDVGDDNIKFEVFETVISTCQSCDVLSKGNNSTELNGLVRKWLQTNYSNEGYFISQFWSPRNLYSSDLAVQGLANAVPSVDICKRLPFQLLRYHTDNAVALRFLSAHETGHNLGAAHDNEYVRTMTQFFMNSYTVLSATRFSTLKDYKGFKIPGTDWLYSSHLAFKNTIQALSGCIDSCVSESSQCDEVKKINAQYYDSPDSVKISWEGAGIFFVKVQEGNPQALVTRDSFVTTSNINIIKHLSTCTNYFVSVQRICGGADTSGRATLSLSSTNIDLKGYQVANRRFDKYDLQVSVGHNHNPTGQFYVFVDHKPYTFSFEKSPQTIRIDELFADGARHRLDIRELINGFACNKTFFYTAPYYRENSVVLLKNDFNGSCELGNWVDSVMEASSPTGGRPLTVADQNRDAIFFDSGNFDSTCFAYYNYLPLKKMSVTSPSVDASQYNRVMLSFDYQYWMNYRSIAFEKSFFGVEVFDGVQWKNVFYQNIGLAYNNQRLNKPIWDTLPPRIFIELDSFKNSQLQIRFLMDKGIDTTSGFSNWNFFALDNIKVDAYNNAPGGNTEQIYSFYPNPTSQELFLVFNGAVTEGLEYRVIDILGRMVQRGKIANSRISISTLPKGIYFFQVYYREELIGKTKKIIKL